MNIQDILNEKEDVITGKGASLELIEKAESELGISFSADYKDYLKTVGLVMCNGHELTGLGNSERTNVVDVTKHMRELRKDIPDDWYVIENMNIDGACMWQNSLGEVYFNKKKEADSFYSYLRDL
ncbi:SMI1/KNR4 family protein [Butyrivibrio sp. AD3002]|uniref:SMI1/KNR4 family protein n=1 Tax=Butyrivibrio sp. AD3002 TaxID=1280670 RepID=UPI0003B6ADC7|nr:SMI1/KNR4 family protein [Butyrivibrio sp. AD3002]